MTAEPLAVLPVAVVPAPLFETVVMPAGSAFAALSWTKPPWMARSPVKVAVLLPPRTRVPWPVLIRALLAANPEERPVPDWVMVPRSWSVPAPEVAVLVVASMTPVPMLVAPAAPNQPVPKVPLVPLVMFSTELLPKVRVFAVPMTAPNWEAAVSIVAVVLAARE